MTRREEKKNSLTARAMRILISAAAPLILGQRASPVRKTRPGYDEDAPTRGKKLPTALHSRGKSVCIIYLYIDCTIFQED